MNSSTEIFRVLLVDQHQPFRDSLEAFLRLDPEVEIVARCASGTEALAEIRRLRPEIVFLEARLPDQAAFDVLAALPEPGRPEVVFVAADGGFALQAFAVNAVDYVLKPFDPLRLAEALARAKVAVRRAALQRMAARLDRLVFMPAVMPAPVAEPAAARVRESGGRVFIRSGGEIRLVSSEEIRWIQSDGDYVRLHTAEKSHLVRMPLSRMLLKLDPGLFVRIHRSAAVNLRHVSHATPAPFGEYTLKLASGTKLKVSRTFVRTLKSRL